MRILDEILHILGPNQRCSRGIIVAARHDDVARPWHRAVNTLNIPDSIQRKMGYKILRAPK